MWFPESPRWLIDHGREEEALEILAEVHGKGDPNAELVQLEFTEIKDQVDYEKKFGAKSYMDLLEPGVLRRVSLGTSLQAWSQLTGVRIFFDFYRVAVLLCSRSPILLHLLDRKTHTNLQSM